MSESTSSDKIEIRRILVAVDASGQSRATLESAVALASRLGAELSALFVEDINLVRLAGLPFAREMTYGSETGRPIDSTRMEHLLRAQAGRLRSLLKTVAGASSVHWAFEVTRGNVIAELLARTASCDLLIIGRAGAAPRPAGRMGSTARALVARSSCAVLLLERGRVLERPVAVWFDGSAGARRALVLGAQLARQDDRQLVVFTGPLDESARARTHSEARAILGGYGIDPSFRELRADHPWALVEAFRDAAARVLVIGAGGEDAGRRLEVLERADFPVVVVR